MVNLNFIAITNIPQKAALYESAGINFIMIDLEINNKHLRQKGLDTLISQHSVDDVFKVKKSLNSSCLIVRVNPLFSGSQIEIDKVLDYGADFIMLPMAKTYDEVYEIKRIINGRSKLILLAETSSIMFHLEKISQKKLVDFVHIGLNDLAIDTGNKFLFSNMSSVILKAALEQLEKENIPYGIGGVGRFDAGKLNSKTIIEMHAVLRSSMVILSRTFFESFEDNFDEEIALSISEEIKLFREHYELIKMKDIKWDKVKINFDDSIKNILKENE